MKDASPELKVSVFQVCSNDSFKDNSNKVLDLLKKQDLSSVDLCVFPENALYINIDKNDKPPKIDFESEFFKEAQTLAQKNKTALHLGTVPVYREGLIYNSTVFVTEEGKLLLPYDKIHLFAAQIGPLQINEGASYASGSEPFIYDLNGWLIGFSICFDLRFSELYSYYAKNKCDLILAPSAFFRKTGEAHWELLNKARAVECQAYVASPAQVGVHKSVKSDQVRKSHGHSFIIHPWGDVIEDLGHEEEQVKTATLSKSEIKKIRDSVLMKRKL